MNLKCADQSVLLQCNSMTHTFSAFVQSRELTLTTNSFVNLLDSMDAALDDFACDVINTLKRHLSQIPSAETSYIEDVTTFQKSRGLLAAINAEDQIFIAEGFLRTSYGRKGGHDLLVEIRRLIISFFVEQHDTECFGETPGTMTPTASGLVVDHHILSKWNKRYLNMIFSAFSMDTEGAYRFKVKLSISRGSNTFQTIGIVQNHRSYLSAIQDANFDLDMIGDHQSVIHEVEILKSGVVELVLHNQDNGCFKFLVFHNGKLRVEEILSVDKRKGTFVPWFAYVGERTQHTRTPSVRVVVMNLKGLQ